MSSFSGKYSKRSAALFALGSKSGFRISELLSIRIQDVFDKGKFNDHLSVSRRAMKGKMRGRTVPLHPLAKTKLNAWLGEMRQLGWYSADAFLFQSQIGRNRPITRFHALRVLKDSYARCGMNGKLATHSMRKHFAVRVFEIVDRDIFKLSRALGHPKMDSTLVYAHLAPSALRGITEVLSSGASWLRSTPGEVVPIGERREAVM